MVQRFLGLMRQGKRLSVFVLFTAKNRLSDFTQQQSNLLLRHLYLQLSIEVN